MENYEQLLQEAYSKVKQTGKNSGRFEVLKVEGHFQGKKTVVTNFLQIASHLRRQPEHLQKFLLRSLAASGQMEGDRLVLNMRVPSAKINQKILDYVNEFVLCRECGKPDTELVRQDRITFLHCLACGAKHPVRSKI